MVPGPSQARAKRAVEAEPTTGLKCPACGAQMHLIKVAPDQTMMLPGYEEHTFECSSCHEHVRRLVFIPRAIAPLTGERMRVPQARPKSPVEAATIKAAWSRALHASPRVKAMSMAATLILIGLGSTIM